MQSAPRRCLQSRWRRLLRCPVPGASPRAKRSRCHRCSEARRRGAECKIKQREAGLASGRRRIRHVAPADCCPVNAAAKATCDRGLFGPREFGLPSRSHSRKRRFSTPNPSGQGSMVMLMSLSVSGASRAARVSALCVAGSPPLWNGTLFGVKKGEPEIRALPGSAMLTAISLTATLNVPPLSKARQYHATFAQATLLRHCCEAGSCDGSATAGRSGAKGKRHGSTGLVGKCSNPTIERRVQAGQRRSARHPPACRC